MAEANTILRKCVHCGFCTATCPTYQLLGDELDSPRGRIYLIKNLLEGEAAGSATQRHLDRCLTCRACETACPSGVQYARLAEIGRSELEKRVPRAWPQRAMRWLLLGVLPHRSRFSALLALGRALRPLLPGRLRRRIPVKPPGLPWPAERHQRHVILPAGCVQPALAPEIDAALARLLDRHGIGARAVDSGCCGALQQHLAASAAALARIKANIDAWWPLVEAGAEAIVVSASACGSTVRDYAHLLRDDPDYAEKAAQVSALCRDPVELLGDLDWNGAGRGRKISFQAPCSLQHGLKLEGRVESLLRGAGFELLPVAEPGMCCGAAGSYMLLQPGLSGQLLERKLRHVQAAGPEIIASANIGCLAHLASRSDTPVMHWVVLLDQAVASLHATD
ncbi:MAG: glycolate oxidase subunit GlcF [Methylobacterium sp.]|nr:glycolate oxidase subunit GlcF [Methylobacterium sp.]